MISEVPCNYILFDDVNTGKTSTLLHYLAHTSINIGGWISPPIFSGDRIKTGYDLLLIDRGQVLSRFPLIRQQSFPESIGYKSFFFLTPHMIRLPSFSFI